MKFLAFVDIHGKIGILDKLKKKVKKEKPDFIIFGGDLTIFEHHLRKLIDRLARLHLKTYVIHGNHEEEAVLRKISRQYKDIKFVHGMIEKYQDIIILGWGGGGFTIHDVEFEYWIRHIKKELKMYKKEGKKIIFVSHAPFYKTRLDSLIRGHHGNRSFTRFIKKYKVDIGICGHFHENFGKEDKIGKCRIYNPGPEGKIIEV